MIGGDFVVVVDAAGQVTYTSVAQDRKIGDLSTTPKLSAESAVTVARRQQKKTTDVRGKRLVIVAKPGKPAALAWEQIPT